jgi:hypothetical protein
MTEQASEHLRRLIEQEGATARRMLGVAPGSPIPPGGRSLLPDPLAKPAVAREQLAADRRDRP